ncbi:hypothetical protein PRIPAC_92665 [Pristionchus pacificus]|uniref:Uncharacterized protein n=1 Tax=Pristionchus pacificus TaxID=54126 RepID=A0A2A6BA80_PRIPA|nr:hypothetical protein PRIPAC_92665 [Pristionchus pacificus]|eukprot:PDM62773.1 hypothetical protein PRIPAC_49988 [Pristionchus pacificus]
MREHAKFAAAEVGEAKSIELLHGSGWNLCCNSARLRSTAIGSYILHGRGRITWNSTNAEKDEKRNHKSRK